MGEQQELIAALTAAGAVNLNIAQLARADVSVSAAVIDLQGRYPAAFAPHAAPFNARTATQAECDAWMTKHTENMARDEQKRRNEAALAELNRQYRRSEGK